MAEAIIINEPAYPGKPAYEVKVEVSSDHEEAAVRKALAYMEAFNERDIAGTNATINFPHVRLAEKGPPRVAEGPEGMMPPGGFQRFAEATGWHHSCWDHIRVVHSGPTKVHLDVQFTRYREDGSVIGHYPSLWVITNKDGTWGIQIRSSYAG